MTDDLVELFNQRDTSFDQATAGITNKIDFVYEAIIEFLNENPHNILWDSIDLNSSKMVVIIARIFDNMAVRGLPSSAQVRVLTIGIPLDIIDTMSKTSVLKFLADMEKARADKSPVPGRNRTLADLASEVEDGGALDVLIGDDEELNPDLVDLLMDGSIDLEDMFGDDDSMIKSFVTPYTKRTLH